METTIEERKIYIVARIHGNAVQLLKTIGKDVDEWTTNTEEAIRFIYKGYSDIPDTMKALGIEYHFELLIAINDTEAA